MTPVSKRAHVIMEVLSEALQVMSLLLKMRKVKALVQVMSLLQEVVKALLKVADVFSLLSPLTRTQTTMPQTRLAARTSR